MGKITIDRVTKAMFVGAPKLATIYLKFNRIKRVDADVFEIPTLLGLYLGYNDIKAIDTDILKRMPNVKAVELENNELEEMIYDFPETIKGFDVSVNPIKGIVDILRFARYKQMTELNLSNTSQIVISTTVSPSDAMEEICLSSNDMDDPNVLVKLSKVFPSLRTIDLEHNKFTRLNQLKTVRDILPKLKYMFIGCNPLPCDYLREQIEDSEIIFRFLKCEKATPDVPKQVDGNECV